MWSASSATGAEGRRALRIPLTALGPVEWRRRVGGDGARVLRAEGAPPAREFAPALQGRAPASSYALDANVLIASTEASGLSQRTLARRGLAQELVLRAVSDQAGGRIEALAFADLRQLLALGERTGLNLGPGFPAVRDDLRQVRAAGAVVRREESDSTAELFLEIP